jgi:hypothetical protein
MMNLSKERIDGLFETAKVQSNWLLDMYSIVIPDWDDVETLDGYPKVSENTWLYICDKAVAFDKVVHPSIMPGGLWLNNGFSRGDDLPDWEVSITGLDIIYNK